MKKYVTMWQVWAGITVVLAIMFVASFNSFANISPFVLLLLICPVMMMFMMGRHK